MAKTNQPNFFDLAGGAGHPQVVLVTEMAKAKNRSFRDSWSRKHDLAGHFFHTDDDSDFASANIPFTAENTFFRNLVLTKLRVQYSAFYLCGFPQLL